MSYQSSPFKEQLSLKIRKIGIITKRDDPRPSQFGATLAEWLSHQNITCIWNDITEDQDMILVLGGDGTLLHIAERAARHSIPVLGINMGNLGFLTELTERETFQALARILSGNITVENRLMLQVRLLSRDGGPAGESYALNDIVISKNVLDRLLRLSTTADDQFITTYRADGLIFSSPTGSTAYNLSAGGPLVYPGLGTITVTPICPFMLGSRPIILPASKRIQTRLETGSDDEHAVVIVDGKLRWEMKRGDILQVAKASQNLRLIMSSTRDYFTILRNKLHWGIYGEKTVSSEDAKEK